MIAAGLSLLESEGLTPGLHYITMEAVCALAGVPRSSSHAAWRDSSELAPQASYQRALVCEWFGGAGRSAIDRAAVAWFHDRLAQGRGDGLGELIAKLLVDGGPGRSGGSGRVDAAIRHAMATQPREQRDPDVIRWLRQADAARVEALVIEVYRPMANACGLRPTSGLGDEAFRLFAMAVDALVDGVGARHEVSPDRHNLTEDGTPIVLGAAIDGMLSAFFEPTDHAIIDLAQPRQLEPRATGGEVRGGEAPPDPTVG